MMAWLMMPEFIFCAASLSILITDSFLRGPRERLIGWIAFASFTAVLAVLLLPGRPAPPEIVASDLLADRCGWFFEILLTLAGVGTVLLCMDASKARTGHFSRITALLVFSMLGVFVLISSRNLLTLYLGLELMTFPIYLAVASGTGLRREKSFEAAMKYFLMGGVASALFLFGVSLVYTAGGSLALGRLPILVLREGFGGLASVGLIFMLVTALFKLSVFPLHFWTPDAYEGASTPVTAFMATVVKGAAFVFLLKILFAFVHTAPSAWGSLMGALSILTMTWGNWVALHQKNLHRLLAYSSIAHVGTMFIAVSLLPYSGADFWTGPFASLTLYLVSYMAMTLGVFAVLGGLRIRTLEEVKGLSKRAPFAACALGLFLLSLTGIPPTAGFLGKFYVFMDAVQEGRIVLAVAGALNSALAAFYYLKIVRAAFLEEGKGEVRSAGLAWTSSTVVIACAFFVLIIGFWPASREAISSLLSQPI